jgi:Holliday junction DNA helicase RuvB
MDARMTDRMLSPQSSDDEVALDRALRPVRLVDFHGQERLKENLAILIEAARARKEALDHVLFYGPPGLGKTTLAHLIGNEMGVTVRVTAGPAIERAGDLVAILTTIKAGDVLFIDEIHRLGRAIEEVLYPAMEDYAVDIILGKGPAARNIRLNLPRFTVVGATTRLALMTAPLRARFGVVHRLDFYEQPVMEMILTRAAGALNLEAEPDGIAEIARRSRGTPRVGLRLLRRVRDFAQVRGAGVVNGEIAMAALALLDIDQQGMDDLDRRVLLAVIHKFDGGPVGLETIAASIGEEADTIMDVVEPYLLQKGFINRTPRGRTATRLAYEHLGLSYPDKPEQAPLL